MQPLSFRIANATGLSHEPIYSTGDYDDTITMIIMEDAPAGALNISYALPCKIDGRLGRLL